MHWQVLGSGSAGNSVLVRAGETRALLDCGLPGDELARRLALAGVAPLAVRPIQHVALTHAHLDHARSAGMVGRATRATVHCPEKMRRNASVRGAWTIRPFQPGDALDLGPEAAREDLEVLTVPVPHDCDPTVAFRVRHGGRVAALVTDMGVPDAEAARALRGAHLLQLEFNHDAGLLAGGPYPAKLKARVGGELGHLSNDQAVRMLELLAGPELHTLVLGHLSRTNNRPALAEEAARRALDELGLPGVRVLVADQDEVGPNLAV